MDAARWTPLETRAVWFLEHADQVQPREGLQGMALQMRLWHYPRSGPHVSWCVLLAVPDYRARRAMLREMMWDRSADWKARMSPLKALKRRQDEEPTVRSRDAEIGWGELEPYIDHIAALRSPSPSLDPVSEDEDVFGLEGYRSLSHVRLQWYGKPPRRWREAAAWIGRLRTLLIRTLRERARIESSSGS